MKDTSELLRAITGLVWPLIVAVLVWRLFPAIKRVVEQREFMIKVAGTEITVKDATRKAVEDIADLRARLADAAVGGGAGSGGAGSSPGRVLRRVLWVDDKPQNNAYEIAQLRSLGVSVETVFTTDEAVEALRRNPDIDVVISDMGRTEGSQTVRDAGVQLIRRARDSGFTMPVYVYTTPGELRRRDEITRAGGSGITASPTELFALLRTVGRFPEQ